MAACRTRKSAEERREEIIADRVPALRRGRLPRHLDRGDRARGRHLPAVPVPAVPHQAELFLACADRCCAQRRATSSAAAADARRARRALDAMGTAYEQRAAARPARAAVPDAGLRDRRDPEIRDARARGLQRARRGRSRELAGVTAGTTCGTSSPTGCCSTSSRRSTSTGRARAWRVIYPADRARDRLAARCRARAGRRRSFALPVFGELGNDERLRRPVAPRRCTARDAVTAATGAFAAPSMVVLVRLGAPVESAPARARIARVAARCATPAWRRVRRATARAATARLRVDATGRSTLPARRRSTTRRRRGRAGRSASRSGWATCRGVDARRRRARRAAGRRPGLGGHRARRADRVPDPLPADAARVPQRGLGAAAAGRRRRRRSCSAFLAIRLVNRGQPDVDLRAEPDQRARAGAGDRLLAVHGLALPRGAGGGRDREAALAATLRTAGRVVAFSAVTVAPRWRR